MRLLGWILNQADWCPSKKRELGHTGKARDAHTDGRPPEDAARRLPRREA